MNRTRVISFRLPAKLAYGVLLQTDEELSLSRALSWFISAAAQTPELVASLDPCPGDRDEKLDFRVSWSVYNALEAACKQTKLSPSVYITKALYHFSEAKAVSIIKKDGRYTLAVSP